MNIRRAFTVTTITLVTALSGQGSVSPVKAQATDTTCPAPVLSRLVRHKIAPGETIATIAEKYNLIPATLLGLNPVLRSGKAPAGTAILVPPYNGIRVELQRNQSWRDIAKQYKVRPDVLFELNGCQAAPKVVFVPGVNWSPVASPNQPVSQPAKRILVGYPLPQKAGQSGVLLGYGWGILPLTGQVGFHGGVDLAAAPGTSVLAAGDGTIAFAGTQGAYGRMVVVNHAEGLQTRYAQLASVSVKAGQAVKRGQLLGKVGNSGRPSSKESHLHFEVRSRSQLGWVAENPEPLLLKEPVRQAQQ